jgi:2-iminobutanoate/2-iminopropanoate deaminase
MRKLEFQISNSSQETLMPDIIETKDAPVPIGPYSQGVRANGFVFVSGQIPIQPETGQVVEGDIAVQTHQAIKNLSAVLRAAGTELGKVVKTTVFLSNLDDFARFNQVYGDYFGLARPARSTIQVARLPKEVLLEIEAIAAV